MLYIIPAIIGGATTKVADDYSERKQRALHISILLGVIYGAAIAAAIITEPALLPLIAGATAGNIAAGKIDRKEHMIAAAIILLTCALLWKWDALPLAIAFACAAFADEWLHEKSSEYAGAVALLAKFRLTLPILCLMLAPLSIAYAVYIIAYDVSYRLMEQLPCAAKAKTHQPIR
ncbi:MAG: hypothetical protein N3H30_02785 [Candidatus Micrarchaeota archaeon]|nr:hypothetical protein [Candidatus Micrarchaeota archaeon]